MEQQTLEVNMDEILSELKILNKKMDTLISVMSVSQKTLSNNQTDSIKQQIEAKIAKARSEANLGHAVR
jgi:ElaB/YqjD/DUF883 family membrane-anchored ribosome-binding protein